MSRLIINPYRFAAGGGGSIIHEENLLAINTAEIFYGGKDADTYYVGQGVIDPGANIVVTKLRFVLSAIGSISGRTLSAEIWTYDTGSGALLTLVQASTGILGDNAWNQTSVDFTFAGASLSNGTSYAEIVTANSLDASNYFRMYATDPGGFTGLAMQWRADKTRSNFASNDMKMITYKT